MFSERLKRARKAASLSLRGLGEKLGISQTAVQKFEKGVLVPDSSLLIRWAEATDVRLEYFFRPEARELKGVEFRKRKRLTKKAEDKISANILDQIERRLELEDLFPEPPVEPFKVPSGLPKKITSMDEVEPVAEKVRKSWDLGTHPIPDLIDVLENKGVRVFVIECDDPSFDGLSGTVEDIPVVVIARQWPGERQRFTLAHELGHLVLHGRLASGLDEEMACNRFAGAFVAPAKSVRQLIGMRRHGLILRELLFLKREFGLSMAAGAYRCFDLGIINEDQKKFLYIQLAKKGWKKHEPEPLPSEQATLFKLLVYRALGEEFIGESKAAELMGMPVSRFHRYRMMGDMDAAVSHQ